MSDNGTDTQPTLVLETETETETTTETTTDRTPDVAAKRPRIRWSAMAWGLIAIAAAVWTLTIVGSTDNRADFVRWASGLGVGGLIVVAVLALGALILLQGVLALLKRLQRPTTEQH